MITFEEFKNTVYYTKSKIVLPLLDIRLNKKDYMLKNKNKLNERKINQHLNMYYDEFIS